MACIRFLYDLDAAEMRRELRAAGLEPLRLVAMGCLSERAFALAEKPRASAVG